MSKLKGHIDWFILIPVIALMLFSIAFVYSASANYSMLKFHTSDKLFWNHAVRVLIAIGILLLTAGIDYHIWRKISKPLIIASILLLVFVLFAGTTAKGATRWISLGPVSFQPSEIAKFAIVIHFSAMLDRKQKNIKDFQYGFVPFLLWIGLVCGLIALQPNFSTMMVIFLISITIMFVGNTNLLHLISTILIGSVLALGYALSAQYRVDRFKAFLGIGEPNQSIQHQLDQSLIALGNGGIAGVGAGQNRQSYAFLPESYGDFIFALIGEEYGFIGLVLILAAFIVIFWRGMLIAKKAPDSFGYFLAIGIIITFAVYVFVNAGVNTGLLPTTGVPMPFLSYGGTAVFIYAAAIGTLLNISAQAGVFSRIEQENKMEPELIFDDDE
jgi:cell division protein FtsW